MKRHQSLQDLSREHHGALQLALTARRAANSGNRDSIAAALTTCVTVFARDLEPHFVREETGLLPAMAQAGEDALVARTLREHAELRALITRLPDSEPEPSTLLSFADLLSAHVRFEEREMFELAQLRLDRQTLSFGGRQTGTA